jgi:tetratricopeptide (TPR) repeat protein
MNQLFKGLSWIGGVALVLFSLLLAIKMPVGALLFVTAGLFLLPPIRSYAFRVTNKALSLKARAITVTALIFAAFIAIGVGAQNDAEAKKIEEAKQLAAAQAEERQKKAEEFAANRESILNKATASLSAGNFSEVTSQLAKYATVQDADLQKTLASARAGLELQKRKAQETTLIEEVAKTVDRAKRAEIYGKLATLFPDNKRYAEQHNRYVKVVQEEKEKAAAAEARKKLIESQFSAWDGSHRTLERAIKKSMNDPDSYEHDETSYWDRGDHLVVETHFRGRNAFGGMVRNSVKVKVDLNGNILEVIEQN